MQRLNVGEPSAAQPPDNPSQSDPPRGNASSVAAPLPLPTLPELVSALRRRLVLATFLGVLVGVSSAAGIWLAVPAGPCQARGLIQVRPAPQTLGPPAGSDREFESFKRTQEVLLRQRSLLNRVVGSPSVKGQPDILASDDPARTLDESIRLRWESPELLAVLMTGEDSVHLKVRLDALLAQFVQDAESAEIDERQTKRRILEGQLAETRRDIRAVEQLRDREPTGELTVQEEKRLGDELKSVLRDMSESVKRVQQYGHELAGLETNLKNADQAPIDPSAIGKVIASRKELRGQFDERAKLRATVESLKKRLHDDAPLLKAEQAKLTRVEADLEAEVKKVRPAVEAELRADLKQQFAAALAATRDQQIAENRALEDHAANKRRIEQALSTSRGAPRAADNLMSLKEQESLLLAALLERNLADKFEPRVQKREDASVIPSPNSRSRVLLVTAAFLLGGALAVSSVAYLAWRSRRVVSAAQVVAVLGLRVIGTIPAVPWKANLRSGDAALAEHTRFALNESVNSARTVILHAARTQNMQVLMVSSATQGEGKTSLASRLATSMASTGLRTLILDCDLRNPSMHKLFEAPLAPGCAEVLLQEVDIGDTVRPSAIPNLWIMPAGQCSTRVVSALAQGHPLTAVLNRLRPQFDFIVVDSCPILPVADALLVGQHVDGVVISVLRDVSELPKVLTASERLTQLNIPLLGAVMNGVKADARTYGYNYVKPLPA